MDIWVGTDVGYFTERARPYLEGARERIIVARIADAVAAGLYPEVYLAVGSDAAGEVVAAAIRTPPQKLLAVGFDAAPDAFLDAWLALDLDPPGISAQPADVDAITGAWERRTGGGSAVKFNEAMFDLTAVTWPTAGVPGGLRPAKSREAERLGEWMRAFIQETGVDSPGAAVTRFKQRVQAGNVFVWDHDGTITTMVGHAPPVRGIANVAPVYTPPEFRGRGYATAATAALSQLLLRHGNERCMLFTDLANPISNHVYEKIGYVRFGFWQERVWLAE